MPALLVAAICRVSPQVSLLTMAEYSVDQDAADAHNPFTSLPSVHELASCVKRGAELAYSNRDKIRMDRFFLHYSIVVDAPCTICYLALCEDDVKDSQAQDFLDQMRTAISNDTTLLLRIASAAENELEWELYPRLKELTVSEISLHGLPRSLP
ncbi:hypothetical protein AAVH_11435 [Aphelenchoides avenae]|nr:hypothetical protein AAVH_11435 [Aphelenchus avenae]